MTNHTPAIIVVAYNRHECLNRLLASLRAGKYPAGTVDLVISVDRSDNPRVLDAAGAFNWDYGRKRVIAHTARMGLRNHILSCGDLSSEYGSIIVLEDDLFVSPQFYAYASACLDYYADEEKVAGVSLYSHATNVNCFRPFAPLHDESDIYFLQFASSWGQAWTAGQWGSFRRWYSAEQRAVASGDCLPATVIGWPETSWLKYFIKYTVLNDLYFVYPRTSLVTNYSDPGTHRSRTSSLFQVPLQIRPPKNGWRFAKFADALSIYDVFFELVPTGHVKVLQQFDVGTVTIDLYGTKPIDKVRTRWILTCRPCNNPIATFGCSLKPRDANLLLGSGGANFFLAETVNVMETRNRPTWEIEYDLNLPTDLRVCRHHMKELTSRIIRRLLES